MERADSIAISQLMALGFMSDRLLIAVDLGGTETLRTREQSSLETLEAFLKSYVDFLEQPSTLLSRDPTAFAAPQIGFVGLETIKTIQPGDVGKNRASYVKKQLQTVRKLLAGEDVASAALQELKVFLTAVAEGTLERVDDLRMKSESERPNPESGFRWQTT